ncbi:MAG: rRNA maturation RNase YbeY [Acidimicrobiia bacterium]
MAEPGEHPEVFGADEQQDVDVDVLRWSGLARHTLIAERAPAGGELSLIFVDESAIADLNERFLAGTGPTDVLAFPLDDDPPPRGRQPDQGGRGPGSPSEPSDPPVVIGDVVVCPAVVERNATSDGRPFDAELARVVVHGVLHLLNYDHGDDHEASSMRSREDELLASWRATGEKPGGGEP